MTGKGAPQSATGTGSGGPPTVSLVRCYRVVGDDIVAVPHSAGSLDTLSAILPQGVYTTFRTYEGGRVLRIGDHLARLGESAALEGRAIELDESMLRRAIARAISASGFALARARVTVGLDPVTAYVSIGELQEPLPSAYDNGIVCGIAEGSLRREQPRAKSTRFIVPASAARAEAAGVDELLLIDDDEAVLEGSSSNFFAVLNGIIHTAEHGVLAGVTRGLVLTLAEGLAPIALTPVKVADIATLQEAFITSVSRAILPVVAIGGQVIGAGRPGPITKALIGRFKAALERDLEPIVPV